MSLRCPTVAETEQWILVPRVAELLGVNPHTVYAMIDDGDLAAEVTTPIGPKRRRRVRVRRSAVDDYLARARITPGELRHLYQPTPM